MVGHGRDLTFLGPLFRVSVHMYIHVSDSSVDQPPRGDPRTGP